MVFRVPPGISDGWGWMAGVTNPGDFPSLGPLPEVIARVNTLVRGLGVEIVAQTASGVLVPDRVGDIEVHGHEGTGRFLTIGRPTGELIDALVGAAAAEGWHVFDVGSGDEYT
jgi:hypothetical protein